VFGFRLGAAGAVVQIFQVRGGRVVDRVELVTEAGEGPLTTEADLVAAALAQFYAQATPPAEIHVPLLPDDAEAVEVWLSEHAVRKVRIAVPQRGEKRGLLDLAVRNANLAYDSRFNADTLANLSALETLQGVLSLPSLPRRIECFDISTIQGAETVASMVVCEDGRMKKGQYRKFKVAEGVVRFQDDFAAMRQVVQRRYARVSEQGGPFPDLILIDGGKGQLSAAYEALESLGLANLVEELIVTRDRPDPIVLPADAPALLLLQRIRDEAHRFAVTFHRQRRAKRDLTSELDGIAGIGPRRRRLLLKRFGSVGGVRRATREELEVAVGAKAAEAVIRHFAG
jgi:excinuclease ABC subunit C